MMPKPAPYSEGYNAHRRDLMRFAQSGIVPPGIEIKTPDPADDIWTSTITAPTKQKGEIMPPVTYNAQKPRSPETVSDLFPSAWLHPDDLKNRSFVLVIASVEFDLFPIHPRTQEKTTKGVVRFERAKKALILNQTQAHAIEEIAGSERFADWPGVRVLLAVGVAQNGKPTITISAPPAEEISTPAPTDPDPMPAFTLLFADGSAVADDLIEAFNDYLRAHHEQTPQDVDQLISWAKAFN